jgi:Ca2+-binding RTX toxin-like protein
MTASNINRDAQLSTIANVAYLETPPQTIAIGGVTWEYVDKSNVTTSGFYGVAYRNPQTNEIAIGYRGTDGMSDLSANITFANGGWNPQFTDAAKFTADVKALTVGDGAIYQGAKMLTTGHSLGDGIAQIMAKMFSLDGSGFEGPGAASVVQNAQFAAVKSQYAADTTGQIGSYTTYRAAGSAISAFGTHLGGVVNLVNLSNGSAMGFAGAVIGIVGLATGGVGGILLSALGLGGTNVADKHGMDGIERAMHVAAGLQNAVSGGRQSMVQVPLSSATGQSWNGDGAEPQVIAFKNASGQVTAYVQSTGNSWTLSTADQQTSVTLTPSQTPGQPPQCVVNQVGKEPYSCVINEAGGTLTRQLDTSVNGSVDQTTTRNWLSDNVFQTDTFVGPPAPNTAPTSSSLDFGSVSYDLFDAAQNNDASYKIWSLNQSNSLSSSAYNSFTQQSSNFVVDYSLGGSGSSSWGQFNPPSSFDLFPIGAFYDSQSAGFDNAASIAHITTRAMNASGQALTVNQLAALDINVDGQISTSEASNISLWADLNENGALDSGELQGVDSPILSADYGFYTQGNGQAAASGASGTAAPGVISVSAAGNWPAPALPAASSFTAAGLPNASAYGGVPASNYSILRVTDNRYWINSTQWIDFTPNQVKINNSTRNTLIGTEGADNFDSSYYANYASWINSGLLVNFMAGGGNDVMGGSGQSDNLWGGTGNDSVYGYAGNDKVYGEEGDDLLLGQDGNDSLDGGVGNDSLVGGNGNDTAWGGDGTDELQGQDGADQLMGQGGNDNLFGQVGNDSLWGGEGNDLLMGFTATNEAQQSLNAGQTDNDVLMGEGGNDTLLGGVGQDLLDGGAGNDALDGGAGDDTLQGQAGEDDLYGGDGADQLDGGADNDTLQGQAGDDSLWGGDGTDELQGQDGADQLMGQSGNDRLFGQVGNDSLWGGEGDDTLMGFTANNEAQQSLNAGQTDNDVLMGEGGNDDIFAGVGDDLADGGTGDDLVDGGEGHDTLLGGAGNDQLQGQSGNDVIDAGEGNDLVLAGSDNDTAWGGTGADELQGNEGDDHLMGEADNDRLFGQVGNDTLQGGDGDDILAGFTASNEAKQSLSAGETDDDVLQGGAGHDNLYGGLGQDALDGGTGNDIMLGEEGNDSLWGAEGQDELQGNAGNDQLDGGAGDDKLFGQAGNDTMWGGDGNDLLMGFTASNEDQQSLLAGESDDDLIWAGAGSDVVISGLGDDTVFGGADRDEVQGGAGHDMLYGEEGNDNLFGQVGNDTVYGGEGDDFIQGFTASNETQQSLNAGETDDDKLYGGAGRDTLVGSWGSDYLDGGAGADDMIGGDGNDVYIVNSVNDTIYEKSGEGYDTVITNSNYLLNANIEELRLLEGFNIHGTGNALDNTIIGNSADNILDGITGADTMLGGRGSDTYYVDNVGDVVTELAAEGIDVVQTSISFTLGANVENLVLLDFAKPEKGLVDGENVLVYGYPKRNELDYMQGDAVDNFAGTCALTSIANLLTQTGKPTTESQVVNLAIDNNWAVTNPDLPAYQLGGTNVNDQRNILNSYNIRNDVIEGYNESGLANLLRSGRGVILAVNAGVLWAESAYEGNGAVNHAVTLTGAVYNESNGNLLGFYMADSGRGNVSDMTRFVDIETFRQAADVPSAYAIYTIEPVKFWQEDINGTGNDLDNSIAGNRGDNVLSGLAGNDVIAAEAGHDTLVGGMGNDTLDGGAGNDVYQLDQGDGEDTISDSQGVDTLVLGAGMSATNLQLTLVNDRLTLSSGSDSVSMLAGAGNLLEKVQFADGTVWHARADGTGYNATMTGQLSITGQAQQGQTLTLSDTLSDPDGLGAFAYQWERSANGVDWTVLHGVTGSTVALDQDLVGQRLRAKVAFTDGRGNPETVTSYMTSTISNVNDAPTGGVSISGTASQGQTLTASHTLADLDGLGSVSWQWLADGQAIAGATGITLELGLAQVGKVISARASYTDGFGTQESIESLGSGLVSVPLIEGTVAADLLEGQSFAEILAGGAGNDTLSGGGGRDTLIGGAGSDTADYSASNSAAGQTQGVRVNLQTGQQDDRVQSSSAVNGTASMLAQGVKLADLDVENLSFVMQGSWINWNKQGNGQAILVNRSTPGQVTLWAAMLDGSLTKAVELNLVETNQGVTVQTLQAKYTSGHVLDGSFDFNTSGIAAPVAMQAGDGGYGVAAISGHAFGDSLSGVENLVGSAFNDQLTGDAAANSLNGGAGNDTLVGGLGQDTLVGGAGSDTADYSDTVRAAGQTQGVRVNLQTVQQDDLVQRSSFVNGTASMLAQGAKLADLDVENLSFVMQGSWITWSKLANGQAILVNRSTPGQVTLWAATVDGSLTKAVELNLVETNQGVTVQTIQAKYTSGNVLNGSFDFNTSGIAAPVAIQRTAGGYGVAAISGRVLGDSLSGVENLVGSAFNDQLTGDAAANSLSGGAGNDTLTGAAGNDTLVGGTGGDTYVLGRGAGQDSVLESDVSASAWDVAQWDSSVSSSQLWFHRSANDLHVSVIGTSDTVTVQNWYVSAANQIEQFKAGDGKALLNTQVDALVNAMAQFAPPAAGQTTLSASQQTALSATLAANWK